MVEKHEFTSPPDSLSEVREGESAVWEFPSRACGEETLGGEVWRLGDHPGRQLRPKNG